MSVPPCGRNNCRGFRVIHRGRGFGPCPARSLGFTLRSWRASRTLPEFCRMAAARCMSLLSTSTVQAFGRRAGLLCPLLTSASRSGRLTTSSVPRDTMQISRGKPGVLHRAPAGFTALALDGYGLCDFLPARPASPASVSGSCSSDRDFAPRFLQTIPRETALALRSCFTSTRLHRGLSPPGRRSCPAHRAFGRRRRRARRALDSPSATEVSGFQEVDGAP